MKKILNDNSRAILRNACEGHHIVQVYEGEEYLAEAVSLY